MIENVFPYNNYSFDNQDLLSGLPPEVCELIT